MGGVWESHGYRAGTKMREDREMDDGHMREEALFCPEVDQQLHVG